jgi:hypothetical protein
MTSSSGRHDYAKSSCTKAVIEPLKARPASNSLFAALSIKLDSALNLPFAEWTEVLGSERLTGALLDRLTHHVHILEMNGDSYRLKNSRKKNDPTE